MHLMPIARVRTTDAELLRRESVNRDYMMRLTERNLMLPYSLEAGRYADSGTPPDIHGGWEAPTCQLRGHFLGHWLSAAAMRYHETGDQEVRAKADALIAELYACQQENGGGWAGSIPEKYLHWIARGKRVWAPHYTLHKTFMGLMDMYELAGNQQALQVAVDFSRWFDRWTSTLSQAEMNDVLDVETGGMLEIWAQLYDATRDDVYISLMERYDRPRLFEPLLEGGDPLTNMHANTTIPEILGCVRAYEATGNERYRRIVEAYWACAVEERGQYATGGQTCGEIWTPKQQLSERLGDKNQEHCTVYNMIRLADALFRWTGDAKYQDYIELSLYNGIFAQGYWEGSFTHGAHSDHPDHALLTYFLPLRGGAHKGWSSETHDFFCCHGTLVQANASLGRQTAYMGDSALYLCQYFDSIIDFEMGSIKAQLTLKQDTLTGSFHMSSTSAGRQTIHPNAARYPHQPEFALHRIELNMPEPAHFALNLRVPEWRTGECQLLINGEPASFSVESGFARIERTWQNADQLEWRIPRGIRAVPLPGDPSRVAFRFGPILLAGLATEERALVTSDPAHPELLLAPDNEREWARWQVSFRTVGQLRGIRFIPIKDVGFEAYSVYFPILKQ